MSVRAWRAKMTHLSWRGRRGSGGCFLSFGRHHWNHSDPTDAIRACAQRARPKPRRALVELLEQEPGGRVGRVYNSQTYEIRPKIGNSACRPALSRSNQTRRVRIEPNPSGEVCLLPLPPAEKGNVA